MLTESEARESVNEERAEGVNKLGSTDHPSALGSGLFVQGKVEGYEVAMLLDTGATVSLLSKHCFQNVQTPLSPPPARVLTADSKAMKVHGITQCLVTIGQREVMHDFYVADLDIDVILGLDFMDTNRCQLDLRNERLMWDEGSSQLWNTRELEKCCRVCVKHTVTIPPGMEVGVEGKLKIREPSIPCLGVIEPTQRFPEEYPLLMANTIPYSASVEPVMQVWNPGLEPIVLPAGACIGLWTPISAVYSVRQPAEEDTAGPSHHTGYDQGKPGYVRTTQEKEFSSIEDWDIPAHLQELWETSKLDLDGQEMLELKQLLHDFQDVFMKPGEVLPGTDLVYHEINTGDHPPIRQPPRRVPIHQRAELEAELHRLVDEGILEPGAGAWSSPLVLVRKKDGTLRICVCYKKLNDCTKKDAYPIPRIDETLDALTGSTFFSTLDLASGYHQVKLHPKDKEKTAIATHLGLFTYQRMSFGLCNAPGTFERLMEKVLQGLQWHQCLLYLDDVIVYSRLGVAVCLTGEAIVCDNQP